jgi:hypothetical protein
MSTSLNVTIDNQTILDSLVSCKINRNEGDFVFSALLEMRSLDFWDQCDPSNKWGTLRLKVIIGDTTYQFLIEERDSAVEKDGVSFTVWGRSKQALLDKPYSKTIIDTSATTHPWQTGNALASAIVSYVVANYCSYGVTVNWNVEDFLVYQNTLASGGSSPKDIIVNLAQAIGAELVANDDGSLSIESYSVVEGDSVASYTDLDDIVQLDESIEHSSGFNAVTVYGYDTNPEKQPFISVPSELWSTNELERTTNLRSVYDGSSTVFLAYHYLLDIYYYSPRGLSLSTYFPTGTIAAFGNPQTIEISETVMLTWGKGNQTYPDLQGDTEIIGDTTVPYAYVGVTYTTRYQTFSFRPGLQGTHKIMFYFSDKSMYIEYRMSIVVQTTLDAFVNDSVVQWESDTYQVGTTLRIRVYNPALVSITNMDNTAGTSITRTSLNNEREITELINFVEGVASLTYPFYSNLSVSWRGKYYSAFKPIVKVGSRVIRHNELMISGVYKYAQANITYRTRYDVYSFSLPSSFNASEIYVWFTFDDDNIGTQVDRADVAGQSEETAPAQYKDITFIIKDYTTETVLSGVNIYVDGVYKGLTDSDGKLTVRNVAVGDHTLRMTKANYDDSDTDSLSNDSFTVTA